jgi:hypothetical protein
MAAGATGGASGSGAAGMSGGSAGGKVDMSDGPGKHGKGKAKGHDKQNRQDR